MNKETYFSKLKEIIDKFENGEERFRQSAVFNQVVHMLINDVDQIKIIDQLINISESSQKALEYHLKTGHIYEQPK